MHTLGNLVILLRFLSVLSQAVLTESDNCNIATRIAIPTFTNSTHEYYSNIKQKKIICSSRCQIVCDTDLGCECSIINATNSLQLDIYCDTLNSCENMKVYCPFSSTKACNIHTHIETSMQIYVPEHFMYGYLNIISPKYDIGNKFLLQSNCFNKHGMVIGHSNIVSNGKSYECQSNECCPWYNGQIWCGGTQYCSFFCVENMDTKCSNMYIDGSQANGGLFLLCDTESANCSNSVVTCPNTGKCSIYCVGDRSCSDMSINYFGRNKNASVAIYCNNDEACVNMDIYAPDVDYINFVCDPKNNEYSNKGICKNITIHAENANKLDIICRNNLACVGINVNGNNAKSVLISADSVSISAWLDSTIIASDAEFVEINCQSGVIYHSACSNSKYYMPAHFILNCNGFGCYNVGDFYLYSDIDSNKSAVNFNGCERCNSVLNCTINMNVFCNEDMVCNWNDKTEVIKGLVDHIQTNCACDELYHNAKISFMSNDSFCSVMLNENIDKNPRENWMVHIIVGIICGPVVLICMYLIFLYIRKRFYLRNIAINVSLNENNEDESDKESDSNPYLDETMMQRCQI